MFHSQISYFLTCHVIFLKIYFFSRLKIYLIAINLFEFFKNFSLIPLSLNFLEVSGYEITRLKWVKTLNDNQEESYSRKLMENYKTKTELQQMRSISHNASFDK